MQIEKLVDKIERIIREVAGIFTPPVGVPVPVRMPSPQRRDRQAWKSNSSQ